MKKVFLLTILSGLLFFNLSFAQDNWFTPGQHKIYKMYNEDNSGLIQYDVVYDAQANAIITISYLPLSDEGVYGWLIVGPTDEITKDGENIGCKSNNSMTYKIISYSREGESPNITPVIQALKACTCECSGGSVSSNCSNSSPSGCSVRGQAVLLADQTQLVRVE